MSRLSLTVDEGHLNRVEHDIAPQMAAAITMQLQGLTHPLVLYLAATGTPFDIAPPAAEMERVAVELARRINGAAK